MKGDEGTLFLVAFDKLRSLTDNSPAFLDANWRDRDDLKNLCRELDGYRRIFGAAEEWTHVAFTAHVPAAASKARRDFEARWQQLVTNIADHDFWALFGEEFLSQFLDAETLSDPLGKDIVAWQSGARNDAANIEYAFQYLLNQRSLDEDDDFDWVDETQSSWDRLIRVVGLDLRGIFWRRSSLPHILFPSHVSNQYGPERTSIYRRLHDAERAFIFGAYLAALAMQRSVLEQLLERHWNADRGHPSEAHFADQSQSSRAHRLWKLGNEALHRDIDRLKNDEIEREVIKNFMLLRELIEGSPERTANV